VAQPQHRELPIGALAINLLGALLLAAGVAALVLPDIGESVPALADTTTAWSLIGVGLALDGWSIVTIVRARSNV
jgi:fluoride ion exporter CrcB/FEX